MSQSFPHAFTPLEIRGKRFKNRFFFAAHGTGYVEDGKIGDLSFAYYKERVTRDISLLITEATQVVPLVGQKYRQLSAADDSCIPLFSRMADFCHDHDCRYFVQLFHYGRAYGHSLDGSLPVNISASALPDERHHQVPLAMTQAMIAEMVGHFAAGARRAYQAGADGVELLVGMGYLHAQFLSPRTNKREDAYGGSPEGRLRFLRETLFAMREATGEDFIIGARIAGEEFDPDGLRLEDSLVACQALDQEGLVDYLNICAASTHTLSGTSHIVPPMFVSTGHTLPYAAPIKEKVSLPIFTCGRINQPQEAEQALAAGQIDMAGMVRALITDPAFVEKAREGRAEEIRACIACNQACIGHRLMGHGVSCIQYPETGREQDYAVKKPALQKKKVAVVGGGPAGMKAAVVAAERGHAVTLYEAQGRLGGQALLAQALPGRAEFGGLVTNLEGELSRSDVTIERNHKVTSDGLLESGFEAIVLATGAEPRWPDGDFEGSHALSSWDVIQGKANVGGRVVIADWRCDWIGMGLAEMLAQEGCSVELCVNGEMAGQTLQSYVRYQWVGRLHKLGVTITPYTRLFGADQDSVYFQHVVTDEPILCNEVDTLVLAQGHRSVTDLRDALEGKVSELHSIGDCLAPRTAEEAVLEGLKVGSLL